MGRRDFQYTQSSDLPDEQANREFFGTPGVSHGKAAHGPDKDHENRNYGRRSRLECC